MPRTPATVPVKPDVIRWARESAGLTLDDAARELSTAADVVAAWESGERSPTMGQLTKIAEAYRRPRSALLLPAAPAAPTQPNDYRTIRSKHPLFTLAVNVAIREAQRIRDIADEILELDPDLLPRESLPWADGIQTDPDAAGRTARSAMGVPVEQQLAWRNANEAYNAWRARLQDLGIVTLAKYMPRTGCRGFSLYEEGTTPVIVVNRNDSDQAKIFTLVHEYAHLVMRDSGLCDQEDGINVERWCNRFAAAFLVPSQTLRAIAAESDQPPIATVTPMARALKVSRHVVALTMTDLGLAERDLYAAIKQSDFDEDDWEDRTFDASQNPPRIPIDQTRLVELGTGFSGLVLSAVERGIISTMDATEALDIPAARLRPLSERVARSVSRHGR